MLLEDIIKEIEEEESQPGAHSDIGASSSDRWFECPASPHLSRGIEGSKSIYSVKGNFYHKIGELLLEKRITEADANSYVGEDVSLMGFDFKIDEPMMDGVILYKDYVEEQLADKPNSILTVEEKFCISDVDEKCFGRGDAVINDPFKSLEVIDLKTGRKSVHPNSKQLKYYALGALSNLNTDVDVVKLTIVQPMESEDYRVKTWTITADELREFKKDLAEAVARVRSATKSDVKEGDWCRFCRANSPQVCPAKNKMMQQVIDMKLDNIVEKQEVPVLLNNEQIKYILDNEDGIKAVMDAVKDIATERAKTGDVVPGYKLVNKKAHRKWHPESEDQLQSLLGENAYKVTKKLLTPNQASKALKDLTGMKKKDADAELEDLHYTPDKGVDLVPDTDRRQAVTLIDAVIDTSVL